MSIEAMKQALEALDGAYHKDLRDDELLTKVVDARIALRAAIEAAEKATPVAWTTMPKADDWLFVSGAMNPKGKLAGEWFPLYAHAYASEIEALRAENAELRRDAERYRWLRDNNDLHPGTSAGLSVKTDLLWKYSEADLDAAIDRASGRSAAEARP